MTCWASVVNLPHTYSLVIIGVSTKPHAVVTGTESARGRTWSMTPSTSANAAGKARLSQKVTAVAKDELVRVTIHVTLGRSERTLLHSILSAIVGRWNLN